MSILELLFTWKIRVLRWMIYAVVLLSLIIFFLIKSINFAFLHEYTEREVERASGWVVYLNDESNLAWHEGLSLKYAHVDVTSPLAFQAVGVEVVLMDVLQSVLGTGELMDLYAKRVQFDNVLLKDVEFSPLTAQDYLLTAEGGNLNTGQGDPQVSEILSSALPSGRKQSELECLYMPFEVSAPYINIEGGVIETGPAFIRVNGRIDIQAEEMNVTLTPQSKDNREIVQPVPITLSGPLTSPQVSVNQADVMSRIGALLGQRPVVTRQDEIKCKENG